MILLLLLLAGPVVQDTTAPTWAKPGHFWYRKAVDGGHLYFTVDAQHGVKEPLFDHQRLAIELNLRTGYEFTPLTLPFADPAAQFAVKYDGRNAYIQEGAMAVEFALDGMHWRCELQIKWDWNKVPPTDYECLPRRPAADVPAASVPTRVVSPDGRHAAEVRDYNVWLVPLVTREAPRALTQDGSADVAYDAGSLRWVDNGASISAYRLHPDIWRSPSITANVKALVSHVTLPIARR